KHNACVTPWAALILMTSLLPGALAQAAPDGAQAAAPPPIGPTHPLRLPPIVQKQLANGLKLVILEDHRQPAVWLRLVVGGGSLQDPNNRVGLAQLTAQLLDKGTTTRTEAQIADTVDGLGATLTASADLDYLTLSASSLSTHTDTL